MAQSFSYDISLENSEDDLEQGHGTVWISPEAARAPDLAFEAATTTIPSTASKSNSSSLVWSVEQQRLGYLPPNNSVTSGIANLYPVCIDSTTLPALAQVPLNDQLPSPHSFENSRHSEPSYRPTPRARWHCSSPSIHSFESAEYGDFNSSAGSNWRR